MLPRVILHNAVSVDGRMDHISPDLGQFYQLVKYWDEDATLVGSNTLLETQEEIPPEDETAFIPPKDNTEDTRPLLVIPDSKGRIRDWHYWRAQPYWRDWIVLGSTATPQEYLEYLTPRHIKHIIAGGEQVDLRRALEELKLNFGVNVIRVDSGGTLNGQLLRSGLVDEISLLLHPALVGGSTPRTFFRAPDLTGPEGVIRVSMTHMERLAGEVVWLRYAVKR